MKQHTAFNLSSIVSWKVQLLLAILFSALTCLYLGVLFEYSWHKLLNNFITNSIFVVILWQIAFLVFKSIPKRFSWEKSLYFYLGFSILFGYATSMFLSGAIEITYSIISPKESFLSLRRYAVNVHLTFLILCIMQGTINLILYFRGFKSNQLKEVELHYAQYYAQLLEKVDDVIQVVDVNGQVTFTSPSIEALSGYTVQESKQIDPFLWIHPEDKEQVEKDFKQLPTQLHTPFQTQYRLVTKTGEVKHVETRVVNALTNPFVKGFIATVRDVTSRVAADEILKAQNLSYELLLDLSKLFLDESLPNALTLSLPFLGDFAHAERIFVYQLNNGKDHWDCIFDWQDEYEAKIDSRLCRSGIADGDLQWLFEQFTQNKIINVESLIELPQLAYKCREVFEANKTKSMLLLPMQVHAQTIGFIVYDTWRVNKKWSEEHCTTLRICNEIVASAIMRHEAEQSTKKSLSFNKGIIESTAEGILLTDLDDNIVSYNSAFKKMWRLNDDMLVSRKKSIVLEQAIQSIENAKEVFNIIEQADQNVQETIQFIAHFKNKRVLECISVPQIIDGKVVGRIWSNRDITERVNSEREEIEKGVAQAQFESLKNQVNPHFLFNSLNVLSSLVHIDPDLSEKFIDQLARSYRYLLEQKDKELVTLKTEIEFVNSFSFLLKIRFEEKLKINIKLPAEAMNDLIAPLTLQLLIENAVKHNTISFEEPLIIDLYLDTKNYLVVKNNLQIRVQRMPSTGVGLKNIINRYKLLSTVAPEFQIINETYVARIPLIKNS